MLIISFWSIYLLQKNVQQDFHEENSLTDFQRRLPENTFQSIKLRDWCGIILAFQVKLFQVNFQLSTQIRVIVN